MIFCFYGEKDFSFITSGKRKRYDKNDEYLINLASCYTDKLESKSPLRLKIWFTLDLYLLLKH